MRLISTAFDNGNPIPERYTGDGENISPELIWTDAPEETKSFALIVHDPDAPREDGFTHWILFNIPPDVTDLSENLPPQTDLEGIGRQGKNDSGKAGYTGPRPPSGTHRYFFHLYALDDTLKLGADTTRPQLLEAIKDHILAETETMGTYTNRNEKAA